MLLFGTTSRASSTSGQARWSTYIGSNGKSKKQLGIEGKPRYPPSHSAGALRFMFSAPVKESLKSQRGRMRRATVCILVSAILASTKLH
jgi:hypothetical protein